MFVSNVVYFGEYFDRETGTYYLRARHFNPRTGRFSQPDPYWGIHNMIFGSNPIMRNGRSVPNSQAIMQSANLFVYVMNNPVRFIDPTGLWGEDVHRYATIKWAIALGFPEELANIIGAANWGVDSGSTSFWPWGNPSRHFDRSSSRELDSRLAHFAYHFDNSVSLARNAVNKFDSAMSAGIGVVNASQLFNTEMERAMVQLGMGLHSLQDIKAHGNAGATSWGISMHVPSGAHHRIGGRLDNVNYIWANDRRVNVVPGNGLQTRLDETQAITELAFNMFLDRIGGSDNLRRG